MDDTSTRRGYEFSPGESDVSNDPPEATYDSHTDRDNRDGIARVDQAMQDLRDGRIERSEMAQQTETGPQAVLSDRAQQTVIAQTSGGQQTEGAVRVVERSQQTVTPTPVAPETVKRPVSGRRRPTLSQTPTDVYSVLHTGPIFQYEAAKRYALDLARAAETAIQQANNSVAMNATLRRQAEAQIRAADDELIRARRVANDELEQVRAAASVEIQDLQRSLDVTITDFQKMEDSEEAAQRQITQLSGEFVAQSMNLEESKEATKRQIKARKKDHENYKKTQAMLTRHMSRAQNEKTEAKKVAQDYMAALDRAERTLERTKKAMVGYRKEAWDADVARKKGKIDLTISKPPRKARWVVGQPTINLQ